MTERHFVITTEEAIAITKWQRKHEKKCVLPATAIGGRYTYCFTPTGIGDLMSVECACGKEKCFVDHDKL